MSFWLSLKNQTTRQEREKIFWENPDVLVPIGGEGLLKRHQETIWTLAKISFFQNLVFDKIEIEGGGYHEANQVGFRESDEGTHCDAAPFLLTYWENPVTMILMFLAIINDSRDQNAMGRQATRAVALFGCSVAMVGVLDDLEAAGNLVDVLDAGEGREGVVLVNVAPRQKNGKKSEKGSVGFVLSEVAKKENGSPFGYFYYGKTLVVSSIDGAILSLVKKLGIADKIHVLDIAATGKAMVEKGVIDEAIAERMRTTQFRSYEFLPRVAQWIVNGEPVVSTEQLLHGVDAPEAIWWIDSFGNTKTTLLPEDVSFAEGKEVQTLLGPLLCFTSLKDVPDGVAAITIGSSGIGEKRFLEIAVQGESAAERFHLASGSMVV